MITETDQQELIDIVSGIIEVKANIISILALPQVLINTALPAYENIIFLFFICCISGMVKGQEAVYFYAADSAKIRGDLYLRDYTLPFIILCHQAGSNRSEFYDIAPRLLNLNYNCLAIDHGKQRILENDSLAGAQTSLRAAIAICPSVQ